MANTSASYGIRADAFVLIKKACATVNFAVFDEVMTVLQMWNQVQDGSY